MKVRTKPDTVICYYDIVAILIKASLNSSDLSKLKNPILLNCEWDFYFEFIGLVGKVYPVHMVMWVGTWDINIFYKIPNIWYNLFIKYKGEYYNGKV